MSPTYRAPDRRDLYDMYAEANQGSDVPSCFHWWALTAVIGAVASPFVCAYTVPDQPIYPDLRVFLVTKSGVGKGKALGRAYSLMKALAWPRGRIFVIDGSMSAPLFVKTISEWQVERFKKQEEALKNGQIGREDVDAEFAPVLLVHQELLDDLGVPPAARQFIAFMTNIASRHTSDYTRGSFYSGGKYFIRNLSASWVAGTTLDWLKEVYDPASIKSGAFSRIIPVYVNNHDVPKQRAFERTPSNFDRLIHDIQRRLVDVASRRGTFAWTDEAYELYVSIVEREAEERDPSMEAIYAREREYLVKVAMILSLARSHAHTRLELEAEDVRRAHQRLEEVLKRSSPIYQIAAESPAMHGFHTVEEYIKRKRSIKERVFLNWVKSNGFDPDRVRRHIGFLIQTGQVVREVAPPPIGVVLLWRDT